MSSTEDISDRWKAVIKEYLENGFKKGAAYQKVYKCSEAVAETSGPRLFRNVRFIRALDEQLAGLCMPKHEALRRLAEQARADHTAYIDADGSVDLEAMIEDGKAHLIREIDYKGKEADRQVVKFNDSQGALDKILRAHGAYIDRKEISGPGGGPIPLEWED